MKLDTLRGLLVRQLRHLYSAEKRLLKALPKMLDQASAGELKGSLEEMRQRTEQHLLRLEEVFDHLDVKARGKKCEVMRALLREVKDLTRAKPEESVLDAALVAAAQMIGHLEIAACGCARTWAAQLGLPHVADLLQKTIDEEKAADGKLSELAERKVNRQAEVGETEGRQDEQKQEADGQHSDAVDHMATV